jgi:hypothetical protein
MMSETDLSLLRRFEPVTRFTRGEQFFPMDTQPYVEACSLWMQKPGSEPILLVPRGELTLETLSEPRSDGFHAVYFLKFIEPLHLTELAAYRLRELREEMTAKDDADVFHAGRGRLARVGYASRFVDALFSLTLLARGRVPGDTAAAAALAYKNIPAEKRRYTYYGRVLRENGWIILQYWYFYPFNDWRSGFSGANDHEADWEMVCLYLHETADGDLQPEWAAYASHDFSGDDLRRRWDDPELEKVGEHPVIYVGAGSHASYYEAGEYLAELELPFMVPLVRISNKLREVGRQALGYMQNEEEAENYQPPSEISIFHVPFVDFARGDGLSVGPGQDAEWETPGLLEPPPGWALHYRGLWGLYARDPLSGEDAPAGPLYNRNGSMRRAWYDPLGWAGLDKTPPASVSLDMTLARRQRLEERRRELSQIIEEKGRRLTGLGLETAAMRNHPHLKELHNQHQKEIAELSAELNEMRRELTADQALIEALELYATQLNEGDFGPSRAHIRRAHHPVSDAGLRFSRFAEFWAAVSASLMMIGFVGVVLFAREYLIFGLAMLISLFIFIEAGFRRHLASLVISVTTGLAFVAALIILFDFFWSIVIAGALLAGGYILLENLRELRS